MSVSAATPTRWRCVLPTVARSPSTPASSCTTSAPTPPCCGSSPSSASARRQATCPSACAARAAASSTRERAACTASCHGRVCSDGPATCACWSRSSVFTATPAPCCATPPPTRSRWTSSCCQGGYSRYFTDHFMLPLTAAVWSSSPTTIRDFPARYLIRFFANHGMLTVKNSPQWRTVTGGSREYVARIAERLADRVHTPHAGRLDRARRGRRHGQRRPPLRPRRDRRPPRPGAARCWSTRRPDERAALGGFAYSSNQTVLHTDASLLPRAAGARASWNYLLDACSTSQPGVHVTYHLNRLQALHEPVDYCVTLNGTTASAAGHELRRMTYEHPDLHARESWRRRRSCRGSRVTATRTTAAPTTAGGSTRTAASRACAPRSRWGAPGEVGAVRGPRGARPAHRAYATSSATRVYMWLVDLDELPSSTGACGRSGTTAAASPRSAPATTSATPAARSSRTCSPTWRRTGVDLEGGRVSLLTNARVLGYVFNPLSVYYCHGRGRRPSVRRRRGAQHLRAAALLPARSPASSGRCETGKEFYVSPFLTVDGRYRMTLAAPGERLSVQMALHQGGQRVFAASLTGRRRPLTNAAGRADAACAIR